MVIVCTKNMHLPQAMEDIKKHVGANTTIMSLLNGVESEELLCQKFGKEHVLWSFITGLNSVHEGTNTTCAKEGHIVFGEDDNIVTARVLAIQQLFDMCGIQWKTPKDIHHEQWWKFMLNTAYNTLSAITRSTYEHCSSIPMTQCVQRVFPEVQAVAHAKAIELTQEDVQQVRDMMASLCGDGMTSMLQDVTAKRKTENQWFCGTVSRLGRRHGIPTPTCDLLCDIVEAIEAAY